MEIAKLPARLITSFFSTPWGNLETTHDNHFVYRALFTQNTGTIADHPLAKLIRQELDAYIINPHHRFQLPLKPQVSIYQQKVLNSLLIIPVGRTITYGELSASIQSSPRAVGQACKRNPLALFIPCHRVVGKHNLGGYMGDPDALSYKIALINHEQKNKS